MLAAELGSLGGEALLEPSGNESVDGKMLVQGGQRRHSGHDSDKTEPGVGTGRDVIFYT